MKDIAAFFKDQKINLVTDNQDGKAQVTQIPPASLAGIIEQDFVWVDEVVDQGCPLAECYLIQIDKLSRSNAQYVVRNEIGYEHGELNIVLVGDTFYFIKEDSMGLFSDMEENESNKAMLDELRQQIKEMKLNFNTLYRLGLPHRRLIHKIFTENNVPVEEDQSIEKIFTEIKATHGKLAIKKINDIVGYGVVALEDIPPNTMVTFYAGLLYDEGEYEDKKTESHLSDPYGIQNQNHRVTTGKTHRNFGGFLTHAFPMKNSDGRHLVTIEDYENTSGAIDWYAGILEANLKIIHKTYAGKPYWLFSNPCTITAGTVLTFNYGAGYWAATRTCPALITRTGELIPPSSYAPPLVLQFDYLPQKLVLRFDNLPQKPVQVSEPAASTSSSTSSPGTNSYALFAGSGAVKRSAAGEEMIYGISADDWVLILANAKILDKNPGSSKNTQNGL